MTPQPNNADDLRAMSYEAFLASLGAVLDTEAGLREILLASDHDAVVARLDTVLDVDAGLAAILPATKTEPPADPAGRVEPWTPNVDGRFRVAMRSSWARIALRADQDLVRSTRLMAALSEMLDRLNGFSDWITVSLGADFLETLQELREFGDEIHRYWEPEPENEVHPAVAAVERFADTLLTTGFPRARWDLSKEGPGSSLRVLLARARGLLREEIEDLVCLAQDIISEELGMDLPTMTPKQMCALLDDFTTADLRSADVLGVSLVGVRWTDQTRWPKRFNSEDLKSRSLEVPPCSGIYVVQHDATSVELS